MALRNIDHLNLSVANLEESVSWYNRVFGFEVVEDGLTEDGAKWCIIRGGDAMLCMYERPGRTHLDGEEMAEMNRLGVSHFGLRIDDPEAFGKIVEREKIEVHYGGAVRWKHSNSWYINDPSGYTIEVAHWDNDRIDFT
ncbi:MAG: VOC family protein [Planctomycetes bacterium]|nr:VOC family protein [Planctomycetota bacterium]